MCMLLASEQSERDTIRGNKWESEIYFDTYIYIYIWYVPDTLVAQARWYVMWGELSVNYFLKHSNHLKPTQNVLKWNRVLWLLFDIQFLTMLLLLWRK